MIKLNSKEAIENSNVPFFVASYALRLLDLYDTCNLEPFGGVYWIEKQSELIAYHDKPAEFVEIIMTEKESVWHASFVHNNDFSTDVYVPEYLIDEKIRKDWQANLIRKVYEDEFH